MLLKLLTLVPLIIFTIITAKLRTSFTVFYEVETELLGAFAKLGKATSIFFPSVRPSVRLSAWNNSVRTGRILMKLHI